MSGDCVALGKLQLYEFSLLDDGKMIGHFYPPLPCHDDLLAALAHMDEQFWWIHSREEGRWLIGW